MTIQVQDLQIDGNLEDHIPLKVMALHGLKESKDYPETLCTMAWKRDHEKGYVPKNS